MQTARYVVICLWWCCSEACSAALCCTIIAESMLPYSRHTFSRSRASAPFNKYRFICATVDESVHCE